MVLHTRLVNTCHPSLLLSADNNVFVCAGNAGSAVLTPNSTPKSLTQPMRRTAGSSIVTSTTFDRSFIQRKAPHKPVALDEVTAANSNHVSAKDEEEEDESENSEENGDLKSPTSKEVKSDPESDLTPKKQTRSRLSKFGSFSHGHSTSGKEPRLQKPSTSKSAIIAEGAVSVVPQSKPRAPGGVAKLQAPTSHKNKDALSSSSEDPPEGSPRKEPPARPPSRLKCPGSGPSSTGHSGMQYHHIPLNKRTSGSASNLNSSGEEAAHAESRLRMQRNGSDGAIKRHQVIQAPKAVGSKPVPIESGKSSLPRHVPKGTLVYKQPLLDAGEAVKKTGGGAGGIAVQGDREKNKDGRHEDKASEKTPPTSHGFRACSVSSGLKRPGTGLKKSGSFVAGSVRTPNLPSGPQAASMEEGRQGGEGEGSEGDGGGRVSKNTASPPKNSSMRQLMQPKSRGESHLTKPTSPSTKRKLHKPLVGQGPTNHSPPAVTDSRVPSLRGLSSRPVPSSLLRGKGAEVGSNSSLESSEVPMSSGESEDQKVEEKEKTRSSAKEKGRDGEKSGMSLALTNGALSSKLKDANPASSRSLSGNSSVYFKSEKADLKRVEVVENGSKSEEEEGKENQNLLRYGRRISPEGMSHEEIHSDKVDEIHSSARAESKGRRGGSSVTAVQPSTPVAPSHLSPSHLSPSHLSPSHGSKDQREMALGDTDDSESASSTDKEVVVCGEGRENDEEQRQSRSISQETSLFSPNADGDGMQRARSLSPKASHRLVPRGVARVRDMEGGVSGAGELHLHRSNSSDSTSSENASLSFTSLGSRKPLKSSLRQKGGNNSRHSSSSSSSLSVEANGGSPRQTKVTISPRSSQVRQSPPLCVRTHSGYCCVGLETLCWHTFEHNPCVKVLSITPA